MQKNMEILNNEDKEINDYIDGVVEHYNKYSHPAFKAERIDNKITPQALVDRGFEYHSAGRASGCDQWQGLAHWINKEKDVHLRGNVSTAKGGTLYLWAFSRIAVDNLEELDALIKLVK
jgi:hypothetical protein